MQFASIPERSTHVLLYDAFVLFATFFCESARAILRSARPPYPHRLLKTLWTTARDFARACAISLGVDDMGRR